MRRILLLTVVLTFIMASSACLYQKQKPSTLAADISGKWTLTWWGAGADESFPLVIKAVGENLTITGTHPSFGEMTGTGTLKGDSISMTIKSSSMEFALTGKVTGNRMAGAREIKASPQGGMSSSTGDGRGGGAAPQGGMPEGTGGAPGGAAGGPQGGQGGAPGGAPPQGGMPEGAGGAPQGGQGTDAAGGNENWTAVKN